MAENKYKIKITPKAYDDLEIYEYITSKLLKIILFFTWLIKKKNRLSLYGFFTENKRMKI